MMTRASSAKEEWERDRLDPDNYWVIPEFNVLPAQVDFMGFSRPVVAQRTRNRVLARQLRELLTMGRVLARKAFPTLAALKEAKQDAFRRVAAEESLSDTHYAALEYESVESMEGITLLPPEVAEKALAIQAVLIARWAVFGAVDAATLRRTEKARQSGIKSGQMRRLAARSTENRVLAAARNLGWPNSPHRGISVKIHERLGHPGERRIRAILKAAENRN